MTTADLLRSINARPQCWYAIIRSYIPTQSIGQPKMQEQPTLFVFAHPLLYAAELSVDQKYQVIVSFFAPIDIELLQVLKDMGTPCIAGTPVTDSEKEM